MTRSKVIGMSNNQEETSYSVFSLEDLQQSFYRTGWGLAQHVAKQRWLNIDTASYYSQVATVTTEKPFLLLPVHPTSLKLN